jgi:uncharacterized protein YlaI
MSKHDEQVQKRLLDRIKNTTKDGWKKLAIKAKRINNTPILTIKVDECNTKKA